MPKTLLLADDSVTIQKVVGISFASEDITITTVDNGDDAVAKAREIVPDVILADVVMPGLSGYEVCETIKSEPSLRHIPVLLLTGTFEAFDEARASAAGAAGHVSKPFEAQTLIDRVHQLLEAAPQPEVAPEVSPTPAVEPASADAPNEPGATTDTFDFFSDDAAPGDGSPLADGTLDLEGEEGAFAFGDDDFADAIAPEPTPDHTIAIMPEAPDAADGPDALDFSFDGETPDPLDAPMNPADLGHTTLLDPAAGADLDVSSSDLAVGFADNASVKAPETIAAPQPPPVPEPARAATLPNDPVMDALSRSTPPAEAPVARPFGAGTDAPDPAASEPTPDPEDTMSRGTSVLPVAPIDEAPISAESFEHPFEAEPMEAEPIEDDAVASELPMADSVASDPAEPPAIPIPESPIADSDPIWGGDDPAPAESELPSPVSPDTLSPAMREELRDTLEKIAWDAFGQVTEKVVREAIERIERAAWEVVPKLAETLIQEEIRRLKGGNDSN